MPCTITPSVISSTSPHGFGQTSSPNVFSTVNSGFGSGSQCTCCQNKPFGSTPTSAGGTSMQAISSPFVLRGSSSASVISSTSPPGFGQTSNPNVFSTLPSGSQCTSCQNNRAVTFGSTPISAGGTSMQAISDPFVLRGSSSGGIFGQPSNADKIFLVGAGCACHSPFAKANSSSSSTDGKTDASAGKESKHQQKLQCDEMEKSVQLICKDVMRHQEDMKSWIERYRSLELEKIEDTQTINQLRDELAQVTRSKDAIIAEYLESPAFTKRLDEEHENRLSEIFHPSYVKALCIVQKKLPEIDTWELVCPEEINSPRPSGFNYLAHKKEQEKKILK